MHFHPLGIPLDELIALAVITAQTGLDPYLCWARDLWQRFA